MCAPALPEQALAAFEALTGLRVCVHDLFGMLAGCIAPERAWHGGPLCAAAKQGPDAHRCLAFEIAELRPQLPRMVERGGHVQRCHAGLVEWVVPVRHLGRAAAVLFAGQRQATDWRPEREQARSRVQLPRGVVAVTSTQATHLLEALHQLASRLEDWIASNRQTAGVEPTRAQRIRGYVDLHAAAEPSLGALAAELKLSVSRTAHLVREATGRSFTDLVTDVRLRTACHLLRHSDLSVVEVALNSGFGDQSYFQKVFRRRFGTTPGRYRRDPEVAGG